jgi:hypothetical protein
LSGAGHGPVEHHRKGRKPAIRMATRFLLASIHPRATGRSSCVTRPTWIFQNDAGSIRAIYLGRDSHGFVDLPTAEGVAARHRGRRRPQILEGKRSFIRLALQRSQIDRSEALDNILRAIINAQSANHVRLALRAALPILRPVPLPPHHLQSLLATANPPFQLRVLHRRQHLREARARCISRRNQIVPGQ